MRLRAIAFAVLALFGACLLAHVLGSIAARFAYPCELSKMEGGFVDHVRVAALGRPIHAPPSAEFAAFLYTPLAHWAAAPLLLAGVDGFRAARIVSLAGVLGAIAIGMWLAKRATGKGLVALGVPLVAAAHYFDVECFYDQARPDGLMSGLWMLSVLALLLRGERSSTALFAVSGTLALLTKQSSAVLYAVLLAGLLLVRPARALRCGIALAVLAGTAFLWIDAASDGWLHAYALAAPAAHDLDPGRLLRAIGGDLLGRFGLTSVAALVAGCLVLRRGREGEGPPDPFSVLTLAALASLAFAAASIAQPVAVRNVYVVWALTGAAFLPAALDRAVASVAEPGRRAHAGALALLALAVLAVRGLRDPAPFVPRPGDEHAWTELRATLRAKGPPERAWVTLHGAAFGAGLEAPLRVHLGALRDLVGGRFGGATGYGMPPDLLDKIERRWFDAIVVADWDAGAQALIAPGYRPDPGLPEVRLPAFSGYPPARERVWTRREP